MPYVVVHFLSALILVGIFRDLFFNDKRKFPLVYVLIGGIAGIVPDLDVLLFYIISFFGVEYESVHRAFTHNLILPMAVFFGGVVSHGFKIKIKGMHPLKLRNLCFVIAFGMSVHVFLDWALAGPVRLFYPFSYAEYGLNIIGFLPFAWQDSFLQSMDAALLVIWIVYLEARHKISDFI
jgi:membrane-bound metal-dependent hydrolase YbcI (DUF457 family)